jgi:hypothetical protein
MLGELEADAYQLEQRLDRATPSAENQEAAHMVQTAQNDLIDLTK